VSQNIDLTRAGTARAGTLVVIRVQTSSTRVCPLTESATFCRIPLGASETTSGNNRASNCCCSFLLVLPGRTIGLKLLDILLFNIRQDALLVLHRRRQPEHTTQCRCREEEVVVVLWATSASRKRPH
jgi:hypothetical protein